MRKALYLMYEGLPPSVIDSQVMTHVKSMRKHGIEFDLLTFAHSDFLYTQALSRLQECQQRSGSKISIDRSIKPGIPFSEIVNAQKLKKKIRNTKYEFIHARTDYSAAVAKAANLNVPVIWDCRGDTLAESKQSIGSGLLSYIKHAYKAWQVRQWIGGAAQSERANFVSAFLKEKYSSCYSGFSNVLGCAADETTFFHDESLRVEIRQKLNLKPENTLFVYSGTIRAYQKVPETIALFENISKGNSDARMLILTPQPDEADQLVQLTPSRDKIFVLSVSFEKMNAYLNAADFGFLLRDLNDINFAASPTKFAEYALTGLPVIHTSKIGDLDDYSKKLIHNMPIENIETATSLNNFITPSLDHKEREKQAALARELLGRQKLIGDFIGLYDV